MSDHKPLSILLVEDNTMSINIAESVLEAHHLVVAKTVKEGIEKFKEITPDITMLDLALPDGNGLDILETIHTIDSNAYVVITTSSRVKEDMWQAYDKGAHAYIMKPFSKQRMQECIEKYYRHKEHASA